MRKEPQLILICCEGKTEEQYFLMLRDIFRISGGIKIQTVSNLGQHKTLVDASAARRDEIFTEAGIFEAEDDIEVWAVCDRDSYSDSYTKLRKYADSKSVNLAFSDPQFENYLLQHFEGPNKSKNKGRELEQELASTMLEARLGQAYLKGDLEWLRNMVDAKRSVVAHAAKNSNQFTTHTKQPFFTVQNLVTRLLSLTDYGK